MAKFLENFVTNENCVSQLLACNAQRSLNKLFLSYSDDIISWCNLRSYVSGKFFLNDITKWLCIVNEPIMVIVLVHLCTSFSVYLVKFVSFVYATINWWNKDVYKWHPDWFNNFWQLTVMSNRKTICHICIRWKITQTDSTTMRNTKTRQRRQDSSSHWLLKILPHSKSLTLQSPFTALQLTITKNVLNFTSEWQSTHSTPLHHTAAARWQ